MPRIKDPARREDADARRARRRARFLELVEALRERWGTSNNVDIATRLGLSPSYIAQVRRRQQTAIGDEAAEKVEAKLGLSPAYWLAESGHFSRFLVAADEGLDAAWVAFERRHHQTIEQLGPEASGWIRVAPFRGGMTDPSMGWALALDTARRLQDLADDPEMPKGEAVSPGAAVVFGLRKAP